MRRTLIFDWVVSAFLFHVFSTRRLGIDANEEKALKGGHSPHPNPDSLADVEEVDSVSDSFTPLC